MSTPGPNESALVQALQGVDYNAADAPATPMAPGAYGPTYYSGTASGDLWSNASLEADGITTGLGPLESTVTDGEVFGDVPASAMVEALQAARASLALRIEELGLGEQGEHTAALALRRARISFSQVSSVGAAPTPERPLPTATPDERIEIDLANSRAADGHQAALDERERQMGEIHRHLREELATARAAFTSIADIPGTDSGGPGPDAYAPRAGAYAPASSTAAFDGPGAPGGFATAGTTPAAPGFHLEGGYTAIDAVDVVTHDGQPQEGDANASPLTGNLERPVGGGLSAGVGSVIGGAGVAAGAVAAARALARGQGGLASAALTRSGAGPTGAARPVAGPGSPTARPAAARSGNSPARLGAPPAQQGGARGGGVGGAGNRSQAARAAAIGQRRAGNPVTPRPTSAASPAKTPPSRGLVIGRDQAGRGPLPPSVQPRPSGANQQRPGGTAAGSAGSGRGKRRKDEVDTTPQAYEWSRWLEDDEPHGSSVIR